MSDAWGFEEDITEESASIENTGPKPLRDAYKALKDKYSDLETRFQAIEASAKKGQVESAFTTLGISPEVANLYQGDANPEAIKAWADNMRAAFGGTANTPTPPAQEQQQGLSADAQAQYQRLSEAGAEGTPLGSAEAALASIKDATSTADLLAAWKNIH